MTDVPRTVADACPHCVADLIVAAVNLVHADQHSGDFGRSLVALTRAVDACAAVDPATVRRRLAMGERAERLTRIETRWPDSYDEGWNAYHDRIRGVTDGA